MRDADAPPLTFTTRRLHLRPPLPGDAEAIFRGYAQDPDVTRFLTWKPHEDISDTTRFLARCQGCWEDGSAFPWAITLAGSGELIGMVEMRLKPPHADLGYGLARRYWGQGYMTEAVQTVVDWALAQPEIFRVWAVCDVENAGSARVLEKAGLQCEGILHRWLIHPNLSPEPRDCYCYARVK